MAATRLWLCLNHFKITSVVLDKEEIFEKEEDWNGFSETEDEGVSVFFDVRYFQEGWQDRAEEAMELQMGTKKSNYHLEQYETAASRNWDHFYQRHSTKFFKNRYYLLKAFPPLKHALDTTSCVVLEIGCGVGNTIVPLTIQYPNCIGFGVDFAASAIKLLNDKALPQCKGFVYDISSRDVMLPEEIPPADIVTMIYVLSAISPANMEQSVKNVLKRLKPGGVICFRDYGYLDHAQLRFSPNQRLGMNYYVRQDGTRSFFFSLESMCQLFEKDLGLERISCEYIRRVVTNRKTGDQMRRVFVNATYRLIKM